MLLRGRSKGALVVARLDRRRQVHEQFRVSGRDWGRQRLDDQLPAHVPLEQWLLLQASEIERLRLVLARGA